MMNDVPQRARGRWQQILKHFGFTDAQLNGRHQACPVTGEKGSGSPRFRFSNKDGKGNYFCSCSQGNEDGFALLQCRYGWDFKKAVEEVSRVIPQTSYDNDVKKRTDKARAATNLAMIERASFPLTATQADSIRVYLRNRGLPETLTTLRGSRTAYGIDGDIQTAMVARIRDAEGNPISMHLTYIGADGKKALVTRDGAPVSGARITCSPTAPSIKGGAVRLFRAGPRLGVAEGIETALSAAKLFELPVWAVLSTAGMESFCWPDGLEELVIFGDADEKYAGQKAAYTLAHRAMTAKKPVPKVTVRIPSVIGYDWNDVLLNPVVRDDGH